EVVFHRDFRGVFHLLRRAAQHFRECAGGHRASGTDFALTAHFGTADGGIGLVENADGTGGEQETTGIFFLRTGAVIEVVAQYGGDDARSTVGRCSDDAATGGVFFAHRERVERHPIQRFQRIFAVRCTALLQLFVEFGGATFHLEPARQDAFGDTAFVHARLHHVPDVQ